VAPVERDGSELYLVKLMTPVNGSGPVLARLSRELAFGPAECLLVHDDVDLPLGTVRVRSRGSDGGHRGVRSVIEAFGTDSIARVKVGVGRPEQPGELARHVVRPFAPEELAAVEAACDRAANSVLGALSSREIADLTVRAGRGDS
jgi:PTH1 family peptidyl-tRNA hydrolase